MCQCTNLFPPKFFVALVLLPRSIDQMMILLCMNLKIIFIPVLSYLSICETLTYWCIQSSSNIFVFRNYAEYDLSISDGQVCYFYT